MADLWENPAGTAGFEFIEYAAPDPKAMGELFERLGFKAIARHRHKNVILYRQGGVNYIVNAEPDSFAQRFARQHGPSICAIAFRVQDAKAAYERAIGLGAWGFAPGAGPGELNIPAIKGISDSLIYFVDRWRGKNGAAPGDIGKISIPINEEGNEQAGQIQEYLDSYRGEGIQHIAMGSRDLAHSVDALRASGVKLLDTIDTYYELIDKRIPGHGEDVAALKQRKVLIDGKKGALLLQIFSENQLGPIFFEFIQRKGDDGFGEGNFKALFESIELDQMKRGVLKT